MSLLTNTRNHTRNKISASADTRIDKDVKREETKKDNEEGGKRITM